MAIDNPINPELNKNTTFILPPQPINNINKTQKGPINVNRSNLEILLSQNDILPLLKKVNHQSKILGRQITLAEFVQQKNVSKLIIIIINFISNTIILYLKKISFIILLYNIICIE